MDKRNKNQSTENGHSVLARIFAIIALIIIFGLIAVLIYSLITGKSANILLMILFCLIVIPCLFFVLIWFAKLINK